MVTYKMGGSAKVLRVPIIVAVLPADYPLVYFKKLQLSVSYAFSYCYGLLSHVLQFLEGCTLVTLQTKFFNSTQFAEYGRWIICFMELRYKRHKLKKIFFK